MKHRVSSQGRYLTDEQKAQIVELSKTHYVKEIAKIMGLSHTCVIENQYKLGIENPKRKTVRSGAFTNERKQERRQSKEGFFDIDAWSREMMF